MEKNKELITGKNREQFEKWFYKENNLFDRVLYNAGCGYDGCEEQIFANDLLEELPFEMKKGVYEAYYLQIHKIEIRVIIGVNHQNDEIDGWNYEIKEISGKFLISIFEGFIEDNDINESESYEEAFIQADRIVNKQLNTVIN